MDNLIDFIELETDVEAEYEDLHTQQLVKKDINSVLHKCTFLEMEHIEIYFKPKEKYVEAFEMLQKLFDLMKAVRHKKIHINHQLSGGMSVENEDFFQAINIFTGELDLKQFLICMHNVIKKKHIRRYVTDEALQAELLETLKNCKKWDSNFNNPAFYRSDFLYCVLINTIDKMNLTDCIIDNQGVVKLVVNIMQLGDEDFLRGLGTVLGTLAGEIIEIVYVDGRTKYKYCDALTIDRKYKLLEFDNSSIDNLVIYSVRVPDTKACDVYGVDIKEIPEEYIKETTTIIPLLDMDVVYRVRIEINLKEECQQPLSSIFELANILEKAFEEKKLKSFNDNGDYVGTINNIVFSALLYNFNITQQAISNLAAVFWIVDYNRDYVLEEILESVNNPDIKAGVMRCKYNIDNEDILSIDTDNIDTIYENDICNGKWIFEADYKAVIYSELEAYFNKIIDNIGTGENKLFDITQLQ